jgi:hypothetical protein
MTAVTVPELRKPSDMRRAANYRAFWPLYLAEHGRPATRALHYLGTALGVALLGAAAVLGNWRLVPAAVVAGYAFAWIGHAFVERNRPATFTHPLWSLISDFRMFGLWLAGRLDAELKRHGLD